jgi:hypothetical protein
VPEKGRIFHQSTTQSPSPPLEGWEQTAFDHYAKLGEGAVVSERPASPHSRGATSNPPNRFEHISLERDADWDPEQDPLPRTLFLRDHSSKIITSNDSPNIGFEHSINPYRGCEHGCVYLVSLAKK